MDFVSVRQRGEDRIAVSSCFRSLYLAKLKVSLLGIYFITENPVRQTTLPLYRLGVNEGDPHLT